MSFLMLELLSTARTEEKNHTNVQFMIQFKYPIICKRLLPMRIRVLAVCVYAGGWLWEDGKCYLA